MTSSIDKIRHLEDKKEEIINLVGKEVYYLALSKEKMIQEVISNIKMPEMPEMPKSTGNVIPF